MKSNCEVIAVKCDIYNISLLKDVKFSLIEKRKTKNKKQRVQLDTVFLNLLFLHKILNFFE